MLNSTFDMPRLVPKNIMRLVATAMLLQIALSWRLWFPHSDGRRTYPTAPIFEFSLFENTFFQWIAMALLLGALLVMLVFPEKKWGWWAYLASCGLLIFLDLTRLQVWLWSYILLIFNFLDKNNTPLRRTTSLLWTLAAIYFWGGVNKLNPYFQEDVFRWWCEANPILAPFSQQKSMAIAVAVAETLLAFGLLFPKTRRVFIVLAMFFHFSNILILSKLGLNWNTVVIPWNLMLAGCWLFFWQKNELPIFSFFKNEQRKVNFWATTAVVLAWVMPLLNFWGLFPENLSWKMYAGTHPEATVFWDKSLKINASDAVLAHVFGEDEHRLTLDDWAMTELGVVPFATHFYFQKIYHRLAPSFRRQGAGAGEAGMYILTADFFEKGNERVEEWDFYSKK